MAEEAKRARLAQAAFEAASREEDAALDNSGNSGDLITVHRPLRWRTHATAILLKPGEGSLPLGGNGVNDMVACEDNTLALIPFYSHAVLRVTVSADGTATRGTGTRGGLLRDTFPHGL